MFMEIKNNSGEILKAGCVVVDGTKVLLITDEHYKIWAFPKGHVDEGETIEQTAVREVLEETGYEVELIKRLQDVIYHYEGCGTPVRVAMFLAKPVEKVNDAEEDAKWVDAARARELIWANGIPLLDEIGL